MKIMVHNMNDVRSRFLVGKGLKRDLPDAHLVKGGEGVDVSQEWASEEVEALQR